MPDSDVALVAVKYFLLIKVFTDQRDIINFTVSCSIALYYIHTICVYDVTRGVYSFKNATSADTFGKRVCMGKIF